MDKCYSFIHSLIYSFKYHNGAGLRELRGQGRPLGEGEAEAGSPRTSGSRGGQGGSALHAGAAGQRQRHETA